MITDIREINHPKVLEVSKFSIPPFYTMEMMKFAAQLENAGEKIYHLEVGQPIDPAPQRVVAEAVRYLNKNNIGYCSALGVYELRQAICEHYLKSYGLKISPESVVITPGTSLALYIALLMNFKRGDRIAIAAPSYPCYRNIIRALGFEVLEIETSRENQYLLTPDLLSKYPQKIAGLLIASPNNPTGSMYFEHELKALSAYCENRNMHVISDEIYHGISYEQPAQSILKFNSHSTIINGFSKYFAMTGWRLGWMIINEEDSHRYECLLQNLILCTSPITQMAAIKAFLSYSELNEHVKKYQKNRDILYNVLSDANLGNMYKPRGAFYLYLECDSIKLDSMEFCKQLLVKEKVAVAPGLDFSTHAKKCSIRLSFCQNEEIVMEGAKRLTRFLKYLGQK